MMFYQFLSLIFIGILSSKINGNEESEICQALACAQHKGECCNARTLLEPPRCVCCQGFTQISSNPLKCNDFRSNRIAGGVPAVKGEFKHQAVIDIDKNFKCSGVFIRPQVVITAESCFRPEFSLNRIKIFGGVFNFSDTDEWQSFDVMAKAKLPNFDETLYQNNLAIIVLNKRLIQSPSVSEVYKYALVNQTFVGEISTLTGYGRTEALPGLAETLRKLQLPIINNTECQNLLGSSIRVSDYHICAGGFQSQTGTCAGDVGGPITVPVEGQNPNLVGIILSTFGCNEQPKPVIGASIAAYSSSFIRKGIIQAELGFAMNNIHIVPRNPKAHVVQILPNEYVCKFTVELIHEGQVDIKEVKLRRMYSRVVFPLKLISTQEIPNFPIGYDTVINDAFLDIFEGDFTINASYAYIRTFLDSIFDLEDNSTFYWQTSSHVIKLVIAGRDPGIPIEGDEIIVIDEMTTSTITTKETTTPMRTTLETTASTTMATDMTGSTPSTPAESSTATSNTRTTPSSISTINTTQTVTTMPLPTLPVETEPPARPRPTRPPRPTMSWDAQRENICETLRCDPDLGQCCKTENESPICRCCDGFVNCAQPGVSPACRARNPCIAMCGYEKNNNCSKNGICLHNGPNKFTCQCNQGYQGDGVDCKPINYCKDSEYLCGLNGICKNVPGGFECSCFGGFNQITVENRTNLTRFDCIDRCTENGGKGKCKGEHSNCVNIKTDIRCDCESPNVPSGKGTGDEFCTEDIRFKTQLIETKLKTIHLNANGKIERIYTDCQTFLIRHAYDSVYISGSGYVMLENKEQTDFPNLHQTTQAMFAPYWLQTGACTVSYAQINGMDLNLITDGEREFLSQVKKAVNDQQVELAFFFEWQKCTPYPPEDYSPQNATYQLTIASNTQTNKLYAVYNYPFGGISIKNTSGLALQVGFTDGDKIRRKIIDIRSNNIDTNLDRPPNPKYLYHLDKWRFTSTGLLGRHVESVEPTAANSELAQCCHLTSKMVALPDTNECPTNFNLRSYSRSFEYANQDKRYLRTDNINGRPFYIWRVCTRHIAEKHLTHLGKNVKYIAQCCAIVKYPRRDCTCNWRPDGGPWNDNGHCWWDNCDDNAQVCEVTKQDERTQFPNVGTIWQTGGDGFEQGLQESALEQCIKAGDRGRDLYLNKRSIISHSRQNDGSESQVIGDPHLRTLDDYQYTFNGLGEYVLIVSSINQFALQCRTARAVRPNEATNSSARGTVIYALAIRQGSGPIIEVHWLPSEIDAAVYIDGEFKGKALSNSLILQKENEFKISTLNESSAILVSLIEPSGDVVGLTISITENFFRFVLSLPEHYYFQTEGLMGNFDGDPNNDLVSRNGTILPSNVSEERIFDEIGQSWRVQANETLFQYKEENANSHQYYWNLSETFVPVFMDKYSNQSLMLELFGGNQTLLQATNASCSNETGRLYLICMYDSAQTLKAGAGLDAIKANNEFNTALTISRHHPPNITGPSILKVKIGESITFSTFITSEQLLNITVENLRVMYNSSTNLSTQLSEDIWNENIPTIMNISTTGNETRVDLQWRPSSSNISGFSLNALDSMMRSGVWSPRIFYCDCWHPNANCLFDIPERNSTENVLPVKCKCPGTWAGDRCEISPCDSKPCHPGTNCSLSNDTLSHVCGPCPRTNDTIYVKYPGEEICIPFNPCHLNKSLCEYMDECKPNHLYEPFYECGCPPLMRLNASDNSSCVYVNECTDSGNNPCKINLGEECINNVIPGQPLPPPDKAHECRCPKGYYRDPYTDNCFRYEYCSEQCLEPGQGCTWTPDRGVCRCADGFRNVTEGNVSVCILNDLCTETGKNPCGVNSTCVPYPGKYECICPAGFEFQEKTCIPIDYCSDPKVSKICPKPKKFCYNLPMEGKYTCLCNNSEITDNAQEDNTTLECQRNFSPHIWDTAEITVMGENTTEWQMRVEEPSGAIPQVWIVPFPTDSQVSLNALPRIKYDNETRFFKLQWRPLRSAVTGFSLYAKDSNGVVAYWDAPINFCNCSALIHKRCNFANFTIVDQNEILRIDNNCRDQDNLTATNITTFTPITATAPTTTATSTPTTSNSPATIPSTPFHTTTSTTPTTTTTTTSTTTTTTTTATTVSSSTTSKNSGQVPSSTITITPSSRTPSTASTNSISLYTSTTYLPTTNAPDVCINVTMLCAENARCVPSKTTNEYYCECNPGYFGKPTSDGKCTSDIGTTRPVIPHVLRLPFDFSSDLNDNHSKPFRDTKLALQNSLENVLKSSNVYEPGSASIKSFSSGSVVAEAFTVHGGELSQIEALIRDLPRKLVAQLKSEAISANISGNNLCYITGIGQAFDCDKLEMRTLDNFDWCESIHMRCPENSRCTSSAYWYKCECKDGFEDVVTSEAGGKRECRNVATPTIDFPWWAVVIGVVLAIVVLALVSYFALMWIKKTNKNMVGTTVANEDKNSGTNEKIKMENMNENKAEAQTMPMKQDGNAKTSEKVIEMEMENNAKKDK